MWSARAGAHRGMLARASAASSAGSVDLVRDVGDDDAPPFVGEGLDVIDLEGDHSVAGGAVEFGADRGAKHDPFADDAEVDGQDDGQGTDGDA